jgi:hypothetical protein|tara:strand:- start:62 stop:472 length:411 start_codon:yes stop_codon:yes gene_type:complete
MNDTIRVFKFSNGESIVGSIFDNDDLFDFNKPLQISFPLKLQVISKMTRNGPADSLSLTPWVHPMSEEEYIDINAQNVIMTAPASSGLIKYYNHCINQFEFHEQPDVYELDATDDELDEIELEETIEELMNIKTIH